MHFNKNLSCKATPLKLKHWQCCPLEKAQELEKEEIYGKNKIVFLERHSMSSEKRDTQECLLS